MSGETNGLAQFLSEACAECGTPGPVRRLSAAGGCKTCAENDSRPVCVPLRNEHAGVVAYDMMLPDYSLVVRPWPWAPFRSRVPRARDRQPRAAECYPLASGAMVHVKPGCRCPK